MHVGRGHRGRGRGQQLRRPEGLQALQALLQAALPLTTRTVDAPQARPLDDFIFCCPLFLQTLAAQTEQDAFARAVRVKVSVSLSLWPLVKGYVQRVRVQLGE